MIKKENKNTLVLIPSYWASLSGGKDSLKMFELILNNLIRYPLDGVVHFELETDYPFIKNVIDYIEDKCKKIGLRFVRIKPRKNWKELYDKYGFPTRKARWCNDKYKLDAKKQLKDFLKSQNKKLICYIGYCKDEVGRYEERTNKNEIYPLVENNIMESEILEWAKDVPIFNDYYKFNRRQGCALCPMQSLKNMAYLFKYYPEFYHKCISLAKATEEKRSIELGRPFSVFDSNPKYNANYRDMIVRTKWLPRLEEEIKKYKKP